MFWVKFITTRFGGANRVNFFRMQKCSNFVTSKYSKILIRDKQFKVLNKNKKGLVQLLSLLPTSYPGHSILTDDIEK